MSVNAYGTGGVASVNSVGMPVNPAPLSDQIDSVRIGASATQTGCVTSYRTVNSTFTTNPTLIKAAPAVLYGYECYNVSATTVFYYRLYNSATTVTTASACDHIIVLPPISTATAMQVTKMWYPQGIAFPAGIATRLTGSYGEADNTSVQTLLATVQLFYK